MSDESTERAEKDLAFVEKLRTIGFTTPVMKQPRTTQVLHQKTGKPVGTTTEHKDGRVDATVTPPTVTALPGVQAKEKK